MKTILTIKQSKELIELGVDPSKASENTKIYEQLTEKVRWESKVPIFTLADLLELLPKEIYSEERDIFYSLNIVVSRFETYAIYRHYGYAKAFGPKESASELIDALFSLLKWVIRTGYYQPKNNEQ